MHFEHITYLWFLLVVPLMTVLFVMRRMRRRKQLKSFAEEGMLPRLMPDVSRRRPWVKHALLCLAMALLIVAWANPQEGTVLAEGEQAGIDMAVCIDVSNSMLAQDMKPDRLERSKQFVKGLMNRLGGDRVSLVVFAGNAYVQMPLTNDYSATNMFLDQISTELVATQGTAIGDAIDKGMSTLGYNGGFDETAPAWEPNRSRAIVVISDGENHEDDAVAEAKNAASQGVMVCAVGIGSTEGSPIPMVGKGGRVNDWRRDQEGNVISTRLNEDMLRDVASAGNGIYVHAGSGNSAIEELVKKIGTLESQKFGTSQFSVYESRYQYPLTLALLCLLAEFFLFERRNPYINLGKMIRRKSE